MTGNYNTSRPNTSPAAACGRKASGPKQERPLGPLASTGYQAATARPAAGEGARCEYSPTATGGFAEARRPASSSFRFRAGGERSGRDPHPPLPELRPPVPSLHPQQQLAAGGGRGWREQGRRKAQLRPTLRQDLRPSGGLDGLYGVQFAGQSLYNDDGTVKTSIMDSSTCEQQEGIGSSRSLLIRRLWQQRPPCLKPIHCSLSCDKHVGETIANVVTSLPFILCRKNLNTALYANSLIGVGIASSLYHTSRGEIRKYLRWADYTMIATSTLCLSRALRDENPKFLMAASTLLLPFQPLMVSFAKRASIDPELKMAHNLHKMSSLLGGALFIADDVFPKASYLHAAWHLAAALGVGTCNKLLE
ncbi:hypothetical protein U9M48_038844 [Paspalum notatum var. saurae]|uniref:Uncharacterized protein n=1 Tax=Paspalum notatum var. saurae TaxID=547442 RepID=A0AAQ3UIT9_PASNO